MALMLYEVSNLKTSLRIGRGSGKITERKEVPHKQAERADEMVWDALYEKSVALAEEFGMDPLMSRHAGRHRHMPKAPSATPSQYWKMNMYLPFMDHLPQELDSRLLQGHA
ncbi:hypothetical protein DPMN_106677 [Dreissena polymorpha]|uniref:Uncharacterized protein n=1 Tax=Dreissena polymorpha TaxID=45954 RepID=A0A9D4QK11_DREPO|nr:hypothetical protein DPMN_106677 [Dreissena polymorpha]